MRESIFNYYVNLNNKKYLFNTNNGGLIELNNQGFNNEEMKYLQDHGYYIDKEEDEVQKLENEINNSIIQGSSSLELTISLTNQCNFKCSYCYQDKNSKVMTQKTADEILDKIVDILKSGGYKELYIHYFGGEPLLNIPILMYLDKSIHLISRDNGIVYRAYITTNGSLLSDDILENVKFDHIQLTFDGNENTHNRLRISETFHFHEEMNLLKKILHTTDSKITLRMNACGQNKNEILEFYEYALETFGYERIHINLNRMIKFHKDDKFDMLPQKEYARLFFQLKILYERLTGKIELPLPRKYSCKFICGLSYSISPDGYCNLCSGSVENGTRLFKDVDIDKRKKIIFRDACKKCICLPLCLGGCVVQHDVGAGCCTYEKFCLEDILKYYIEKSQSSE